jgi:hypothetical protein
MRTLNNIDKDFLVDFFSTATSGCDYLSVSSLAEENKLDGQFSAEYLAHRCLEEKWADRLLNNGHLVAYDFYDEDEDGNPKKYIIDLAMVKSGLQKATEIDPRDWADFVNENEDYFTCNNLLQIIIFGKVIYG